MRTSGVPDTCRHAKEFGLSAITINQKDKTLTFYSDELLQFEWAVRRE